MSLRVQVTSSNALCLYCLAIRKCFVCRGGSDAFVVHVQRRRDGPIIQPKPSVTLNKPIIWGCSETVLAKLSTIICLSLASCVTVPCGKPIVWIDAVLRAPWGSGDVLWALKQLSLFTSWASTPFNAFLKAAFWHFCCLAFQNWPLVLKACELFGSQR